MGLSPPAEFWGGLGQNSDKHLNSEWPPCSHFAKQNSARPDCLQTAICATGRILLRLTPKLLSEASRRFIVLRQRRRAENLTIYAQAARYAACNLQSAICDPGRRLWGRAATAGADARWLGRVTRARTHGGARPTSSVSTIDARPRLACILVSGAHPSTSLRLRR